MKALGFVCLVEYNYIFKTSFTKNLFSIVWLHCFETIKEKKIKRFRFRLFQKITYILKCCLSKLFYKKISDFIFEL